MPESAVLAAPAAAAPAAQPGADRPLPDMPEFAELDALADEPLRAAPAAKKKEAEVKAPDKAVDKQPEKATDKIPDKKTDAEPEPKTNAELRANRDVLKARNTQYESEIKTLKAKLKEHEDHPPVDTKPYEEKTKALEARNAELEREMEFVNFTRSKKFETDFQKPYVQAYQRALADTQQLTVQIPDGVDETTGEPKFTKRQATENDLLKLANASVGEMDELAEKLFGRSSARMIRHAENLKDLSGKQQAAIDEARNNGQARQQQYQEYTKQTREKQKALWQSSNDELAKKYPNWFGKIEGDEAGNKLFEKGEALAARLFTPTDETRPKTPEEAVKLHALISAKVKNHDRLLHRLKTANAKIKELETSLSEYDASNPPGGKTNGRVTAPKAGLDGDMQEIDALAT